MNPYNSEYDVTTLEVQVTVNIDLTLVDDFTITGTVFDLIINI